MQLDEGALVHLDDALLRYTGQRSRFSLLNLAYRNLLVTGELRYIADSLAFAQKVSLETQRSSSSLMITEFSVSSNCSTSQKVLEIKNKLQWMREEISQLAAGGGADKRLD